jgi:hypothetical protein
MSAERSPDVLRGGRDPDRPPPRLGRLLAALAVALIAGGVAFHLISGHPGPVPPPPAPRPSPSPVALTAPQLLHGPALRPGGAPATLLFLGGQELRLLSVGTRVPPALTSMLPGGGDARDPLGPDPAVQQLIPVDGGVVALIDSEGPANLPDIGDVLFIPVGAHGAGLPLIIARANYVVLAPDHREVWVEQAGPPWGDGPSGSPAWLVSEDGQRLSAIRHLNNQALLADTVRGLLLQGPDQELAFTDPVTGHTEPTGIPAGAIIAATDANQVAWQAAACAHACPLHVTDLQGGPGAQFTLPPGTVLDTNDTADFDPAGQRLALALDSTGRQDTTITGTFVYVADVHTGTLTRVPGGPVPAVTLPAVLGAFPAGSSAVICARWSADGSGLWIVATDGLFFQAGYWAGHGPLRVLQPQGGLAYKLAL